MAEANAASDGKRKFTQHMVMHMNGGSKFSELHYDVYADGAKTSIRHFRATNGRPKYLITDDVFVCGDDRFDNLAAKGNGLMDWLEAHTGPKLHAESEEAPA
jgi:phosphoglycolate phosphatase-like HAD superfamily hydrolase